MVKEIRKLGIPDYIGIQTEKAQFWGKPEQGSVQTEDVEVTVEQGEENDAVMLHAKYSAVKWVKLHWNMEISSNARIFADEWERGYGNMEWKGMNPNRMFPWYFLHYGEETKVVWGAGVMVRPGAMCQWLMNPKGITLYLDVRCGGAGVHLKGRTLCAARIVSREFSQCTVFEAAREFCRAMCPDPVFPEKPVYGSNNWYYAYGDSSQKEILRDTDYLCRLTKGLENPPFMVVDDCWQEHHRLEDYNGGPWRKGNAKFPDMKGLADAIKERGARPGIWVRFLLNEDEAIKPEWRLSHNGCLDPSHPEARAYIRQDMETICKWGYELVKHDFSTFDLFGKWGFQMNPLVTSDGWSFYDRTKTSAEIVTDFYQMIWDVAKEYQVIIIGCNTIGHLGAGLMQLNRIGDDTSGKRWERTRQLGVNSLAFRLMQHRTFYDIDADCVGIAGAISWEKNRQWSRLLAKSGTPFFLSAVPDLLDEEQEKELAGFLEIASKQEIHVVPCDWLTNSCPEIWSDGETTETYDWYEEKGMEFDYESIRYTMMQYAD